MTVSLRGHHLLCMLAFAGDGYTPNFTRNYTKVVERLNAGENVLLISGPDEICSPLLVEQDKPHCHNESVLERDRIAMLLVSELFGEPIALGYELELGPEKIAKLRKAYAKGRFKPACAGCEWAPLCTRIAKKGFRGTKLVDEYVD